MPELKNPHHPDLNFNQNIQNQDDETVQIWHMLGGLVQIELRTLVELILAKL